MTDFCNNSVYFGVAVSLVGYVIGVQLKKKFKLAVLNPLMISIIFVVGVVLLFKLDYPSYKKQAEILRAGETVIFPTETVYGFKLFADSGDYCPSNSPLSAVISVEKKFTCSNMWYYFRRFCQYVQCACNVCVV